MGVVVFPLGKVANVTPAHLVDPTELLMPLGVRIAGEGFAHAEYSVVNKDREERALALLPALTIKEVRHLKVDPFAVDGGLG